MNRIYAISKKVLSVLLAVAVLLGTINVETMFTAASETTDETATTVEETWKLLASTTDTVPWTTDATTHEQSTVTLESPVSLTTLRLQITKLSTSKKYKIFEVYIYDENGNNIAPNAEESVHGSMSSKAETEGGSVECVNDTWVDSWSYLERTDSSTRTPTDEYIEFKFDKEVTVSGVTLECHWCNSDAPYAWRILGNPGDGGFTYVNALKDIVWEYNDATPEEKSLATPVFTDKLRVYIDKISSNKSYWILELQIIDADGNNVAAKATIEDSSGTSADVLENLVDEDLNGNNPKYDKSSLPYATLFNEYIEFSFDEIIDIREVKIYCWYGGSALTAFSVYANVCEPSAVLIDDEYKLDSTNHMISCVPTGTTAMEMLNKLTPSALLGASANIYDGENQVALTTELKTGHVLRVSDDTTTYEEYEIAVFGDVNGDGKATDEDTVYVENNLDTLTTLQKYAASLNGWNVIGESGALTWKSTESVVESHKVEFDIIPENITSLRVRINVASHNLKYQMTEIKLYGPDGTNLATSATVSVAEGMAETNLKYLNNDNTKDWDPIYTSNVFPITSLEGEYFDFTWSSPVTVCSAEVFSRYSKSTAPVDFDVLYQFSDAETEASSQLVEQAVLKAQQPEDEQLYSDEYVQSVADKVQSLSGFSFTFMTDTHIDGRALYGNPSLNHLSNATRLSNLVPLKAVVHGGDLMDGVGVKSKSLNYISQAVSTLVKESEVPVLMTQGNHDDNSPYLMQAENTPEQYITAEEWYWTVTRNLEGYNIVQNQNDLDGNYFYLDFESDKIRMLVVNTNDLPYVLEDGTVKYLATNGDFAISDAQLDWIAAEALDFSEKEEGWGLVVISHVPLHYPDVTGAQNCRNAQILTDMLEAFQSGENYAPDSWDGDFAQSVSVDFSAQGPQEVIACIAGHNHRDLSRKINGIWYITTAASLANQRAYGTEEEDAFDVFTIDRNEKRIYATRFGAGEDRVFSFGVDSISITLEENITMNYYISLPEEYQDAQMQFVMNGKTTTVDDVEEEREGNICKFVFEGVSPQCMTDEIKAKLIHEGKVIDTYDAYTVRKYCDSLLAFKADGLGISSEKFEALKTLVADLLEYGAQAQTYRNYKTDTLANKKIEGQREFVELTDEWKATPDNSGENVKITAGGVWFANVNKLYLKFTTPDVSNTTLEFDGTIYTSKDFELVSGNTYIFYSDAMSPADFGTGKVAQFKYGEQVEATITYSVNSYIYSKQSQDTNMGRLARALYNYGVSAVAYKGLQ